MSYEEEDKTIFMDKCADFVTCDNCDIILGS